MSDPAVRVETRLDRVAVLTIDQPGAKVNVLTVALWDELEAAIATLPPDLAGLVIASGKPGCFIAGADLKLLADATPGDPAVKAFIEQGLRVLAKLEALPFPTCAAIDGVALGGGLEVALACDWRVLGTHPRLQLGLPEVKLGLIPGWGGTQRLPRIMGLDNALDLLMSGESVQHVKGAWGLIDAHADSDRILDEAARRCQTPSHGRAERLGPCAGTLLRHVDEPGDLAVSEVRRVAVEGCRFPLSVAIRLETAAFLRLAGSDESRAKIAAFFAARKR